MNIFDYAETLWNDRFSHTFGTSGANYGTGSESRAGHKSIWGGAISAGSRSESRERGRGRTSVPEVEPTLPGRARPGGRAMLNVAWRRAGARQVHISIHQMLMCTQRVGGGARCHVKHRSGAPGGVLAQIGVARSERHRNSEASVR
jgi:hypothetical protein